LIEPGAGAPGRGLRRALACAAAVMVCFVVSLAASVPATVAAGADRPTLERHLHCED
jgi:hypothetical protein